MEDNIDTHLLNKTTKYLCKDEPHSQAPWIVTGITVAVYGLWTMFVVPGLLKVPWKLRVPYLPSGKAQTANVLKLLNGRKGRMVDLGSGDGRLVLAAVLQGFQFTGYELNPFLVYWAKAKAVQRGVSPDKANFINEDFWSADLSKYNNVTAFLAPNVVEALEKKLSAELRDDARVVICRYPLPGWPSTYSEGAGLEQVWAYDMANVKKGAGHCQNKQT